IMDASGTLIDSSNVFVPDSFDVNNYHAFYFPEAPFFSDSEYYVGLAQTANAVEGYFPVGVQWETADIRDSAYYRANIDGTSLINNPNPGRLMIRGEIVPGIIVPEIFGDLSLCISETDTLSVGSKITRFANSVIDVSSEFSTLGFGATRALGSPDLYPDHGTSSNQWIPGTADEQREYIVLGFSNPAPVNFIDIYETLNPGAVDTVYVKNPGSGNFEVVYTNTATVGDTVGTINHITFDTTAFNVSEVRIALNSPAVIGFNGIDAVGIGLESDTSDFTSYLWSTSATSQFIEISTAGTYSVTVTDAAGCVASDSVEVITPSQTPPMISVVDALSTTFCQGDSIILISDQAVGNTWSTSETTQRIVVKTAGSYFVIFDDGTGCGTQQSNTIAVTVNSLPSPTITGTLGICPLGSTTLDAGSFSSYNWSTGETTQTINVLTAGTFFVTVTNANGCVGSSPGVTTSISTPPAPTITGTLAFCPGSSTTLDAGTFTTYLWSTTETTQTINVNTAGTFSVTVTDGNGCTGSSPSVTTSVFTTPVPTISGDLAFCPGDSTTLFAENGFTTYSWSTGDNTQSTVVSAIGSYTVTVTDINGCSGTNSATVGEYAPPAPVITGTLSFCGGSSTELDAGGDFSSYLWSTGETSQKILVDSADTYSVTITDLNGCMADTNATVTIEGSVPPTPGPISGPMTGLCDLMLGEFSISPVTNAQFYFWTLPEGVTVIGPSDSNVIMLQIDSLSTGFLLVEAANACGLSHSTDSALISVQGSPDVPGNISGPDTTACNQTGQSYSIAAVAQASSYTWSVPVGATITGGQGTTSITVDFGSESGNVCVTSNNMCSSSQPSCLPVHIPAFTVDAGDCKFVYPSVSPFNCVDLTATVDGGTAPYTYQWTILGGGVEGTTQTINVCNIVNTNYVIEVTDVNGCSVSDTVEVEVVAAMCAENKVPICHLATGQSLCASASAAQNHLDHGDLLGHCDDLPPCAGLLGAIVSAAQQPSNPAGIIQAADPGEGEDYLRWQMYPNPSLGEVYVDLHELTKDHDVTLEIFDLLSKRVAMQHVGKANHLIRMDLRHLTSGIYTVSLRTQTGFHNAKKLIISGKN
ncbi:MAG: T9SS type A sorting domain-containing protein, partial [Saprospiraceae bacterium]|nr:T9SS type A sorting domain-containing protein [Saprospiraceae bacterium]